MDLLVAFVAGRPLTQALLMEYRASMEGLPPSTANVQLAAARKMVTEAQRNGLLSSEEAPSLTEVPNIRQRGTRLGNWLTKEQARELLQVPDRSTLMGKRDYVLLALLVGCALRRRRELASLTVEDIQLRENRWVIDHFCGNGGRIRTGAVPVWVKQGINAWQMAAGIEDGSVLRSVSKVGKVGESLSDWAVWAVVTESAKQIGYRALRGARPEADLCEALQEGRRGLGADQVPAAGAFVNPDDRALFGIGAGDRRRGQRQLGALAMRIEENA